MVQKIREFDQRLRKRGRDAVNGKIRVERKNPLCSILFGCSRITEYIITGMVILLFYQSPKYSGTSEKSITISSNISLNRNLEAPDDYRFPSTRRKELPA